MSSAANRQELRDLLVELSRWSRVAEKNGDLHARIASALALESSAADKSVGERQGRQPAQDIWADPAAARERLRASTGQSDAKSVNSSSWEKADPLSDPTSGQGANAKPGLSDHLSSSGVPHVPAFGGSCSCGNCQGSPAANICECGHNWSRHGTGSGCWECDCKRNAVEASCYGFYVYVIAFDQEQFGIYATKETAEEALAGQIAEGGPAWEDCKVERWLVAGEPELAS